MATDDRRRRAEPQIIGEGLAVARVQPGQHESLVHRDMVHAIKDQYSPVAYKFRVGVELDQSFVELAKRLIGAGVLAAPMLRALRQHALDRHGTVDDDERMFMAGLMIPVNAMVLVGTPVGPGASVTFALTSMSQNMRTVIDLDRESMSVSVSSPLAAAATDFAALHVGGFFANTVAASKAAEHEIRAHARGFDTEVSALLEFATQAHVFLPNLLMAMLAGASDSSAGDQLMAGTVYAIVTAEGDSLADDLLAGHFKVDAMLPAQLNAPPFSSNPQMNVFAEYMSEPGEGRKGDTLYIRLDLDITDISQRSIIIHELQHARDDRAAGPGSVHPVWIPTMVEMEATAFRAQARYVLEQMLAQAPADRAATAKRQLVQLSKPEWIGMFLATVSDRARLEPVMVAIITALPQMPEDMTSLMKSDSTTLEGVLRDRIALTYALPRDKRASLDGFVGESLLRVPPPSNK